MRRTKFKNGYLMLALPLLWLSGCNNGTTATNPPYISLTTNLSRSVVVPQGESFVITATLYPGAFLVAKQIITISNLIPASESIAFTSESCAVSSAPDAESCSINVNIGTKTKFSLYSLSMQASGTVAITSGNPINFIVPGSIFFAGQNGLGYNGDFESQANNLGANPPLTSGITGADYLCNYEAANKIWHPTIPNGSTWKAMLVDGSNRIACTTDNCGSADNQGNIGAQQNLNWVLQPFSTYINESGNIIAETNESAIFVFPTNSSIIQGYQTNPAEAYLVPVSWTGMTASYIGLPDNCNQWTTPSVESFANVGSGAASYQAFGITHITTPLISNQISSAAAVPCSNQVQNRDGDIIFDKIYGIMCIEQP